MTTKLVPSRCFGLSSANFLRRDPPMSLKARRSTPTRRVSGESKRAMCQRPPDSASDGASKMDMYSEAIRAIETEYVRLGHTRDWRFLATPRQTLAAGSPVAFFTLNPGEGWIDPDHGRGSSEGGSAYVRERWHGFPAGESPLQFQVRAMFEWLGLVPDQPLTAYFIPFRSRDYETLPSRRS